ncbi:MAG: tRNA epoxyqueuosine(34) reductase QueG [Chloroflexi bacterium]|nr:tRNA epoxyqueuosine(34) reductase QueG [Ardenticatenaceae bacterium]MBL1128726.1 tRNA epoxyqueuosine(34) reductase QueG [Chloroflexota bacterium]NOG34804.1 tRNA epoxyqueuosine(34) reductase QueG [Chloroflexota bacterium]GIK55868.1 MAG: epoxyqueuosine reductase [Chloroflexota bacterium]
MDDLATAVTQKAHTLGFNLVGFVPAQPARRLDAYLRWLEVGMHGRMAYLARPDRIARRRDLNIILPGVQTIICVGLDYATPPLPPAIANDPSRGRISNYAWGPDYHEVMTPRLAELADWLIAQVEGVSTLTTRNLAPLSASVQSRVYVDTGAILERDHAESAGLGFTGKNTMLIHPRRGSFFFLGEILTTLEIGDWRLEIGSIPNLQSPISCGNCHRCLDACPTNAFPQPYVLDARRCISYLTIELKEWIPVELRPLLGNWIYGCDICQEVCPFNRFATPGGDWRLEIGDWSGESPISHPQSLNLICPPLLDLLSLTENDFEQRFAHSPIKRLKRARFLRNVCVAVGNWGSSTAPSVVDGSRPHAGQAVSALIPLLSDPHPLVRGHAAWALHQIGGPAAQTALVTALETETDETVRMELAGL